MPGSPRLPRGAFAAVVYVSEGRRPAVLDMLERSAREAAASRRVALANVYRDAQYNRTGFTLAGADIDGVRQTVLAVAAAALPQLDLRVHDASHPRVGVVDHVSCHALRGERTDAAELARKIGQGLALFGVPVKLYGDAASDGIELAQVRRDCGYFSSGTHHREGDARRETARGELWSGKFAPKGKFTYDFLGPDEVTEKLGFCMVPRPIIQGCIDCLCLSLSLPLSLLVLCVCVRAHVCVIYILSGQVGATPWVCNYNIPLEFSWQQAALTAREGDKRALSLGRVVAKQLSARGGGLPQVQAMALAHGDRIVEVACNLLDTAVSSASDVQQATASILAETNPCDYLGSGASVFARQGYFTNQTSESIIAVVDRQHTTT